jgi:hypothetical protein
MIRLGQHDVDTLWDKQPHKQHADRLQFYLKGKNKS